MREICDLCVEVGFYECGKTLYERGRTFYERRKVFYERGRTSFERRKVLYERERTSFERQKVLYEHGRLFMSVGEQTSSRQMPLTL